MIDPSDVPQVDPNELLARFIFSRGHIRNSDETIKPQAFMPPPHAELSVTRHRDATSDELWAVGRGIGLFRERSLHGRGDVLCEAFVEQGLEVIADPDPGSDPMPENSNHANVIGWPKDDMPLQMQIAQLIASQAKLVRPPAE